MKVNLLQDLPYIKARTGRRRSDIQEAEPCHCKRLRGQRFWSIEKERARFPRGTQLHIPTTMGSCTKWVQRAPIFLPQNTQKGCYIMRVAHRRPWSYDYKSSHAICYHACQCFHAERDISQTYHATFYRLKEQQPISRRFIY